MKILKYLLFLILLIIIGSAIYFGTKEGDYHIKDSRTIAAPTEVVFEKVNDFKSWQVWTPWRDENPDAVFNLAEKSTGEGASVSWDGNNGGSVITKKVIPNKEIEQELTFQTSGGKRKAEMYWYFESKGDSTEVRWEIKGKQTLIDKAYNSIKGSNFVARINNIIKTGLNNLDEEVVADMKKYNIHVDGVTQYGGGYYMYTTSVAKSQEVIEKSVPMITLVKDFISNNNLNKSGEPFIIYNEVDTNSNTVIFSTAIPLRERVITPENSPVVSGFMDPVAAVKVSLKGNYGHLSEALQKGMAYMQENSLSQDPDRKIFEIFTINEDMEPNPAKWLTEIYIPIQTTDESTNNPDL